MKNKRKLTAEENANTKVKIFANTEERTVYRCTLVNYELAYINGLEFTYNLN